MYKRQYIHPKPFFDLLGLSSHTSEFFDITGQHKEIADPNENFWGIYNTQGEAVLYQSDTEQFIERIPFKQIFYVDQKNIVKHEDDADTEEEEEEEEEAETSTSTEGGRGRKRISSDGQLHREFSAKRRPFSGFDTPVKIYMFFDNTNTSMVDNMLTGRRKPLTTAKIPIFTHTKIDELMYDFHDQWNLFNPSKKIFDAALTANSNDTAIFDAETKYEEAEPWTLSIKPIKLNNAQITTYENGIIFEIYCNKLFTRFMGYEEPVISEQLVSIPFYRYKTLTFTNSFEFVKNETIMSLLRDPYPLFVCLSNSKYTNMKWRQKTESSTIGHNYSVAAIVNSNTNSDLHILKEGHVINLQLDHPSKINIQVISREGLPVQYPIHVFATFIVTKKY